MILSTQSQVRNMRHLLEYNRNSQSEDVDFQTAIDKIINKGIFYRETREKLRNISPRMARNQISNFKLIGFVIEKKEKRGEEGSSKYPLIFVPCFRNPDESDPFIPSTYLDSALNYGSRYVYSVRSVFVFSVSVSIGDEAVTRSYFVNSSYSKSLDVDCVETIPPPPPRDFSAFFDYTIKNRNSLGKLRLTWSFPVNLQRDTAGFAIFRRKSIYEPFNLIKILDFNFSLPTNEERLNNYKFKVHSAIRNSVVTFLKGEDTYTNYVDDTFRHNSNYIYTICSIDAHGQISNYGTHLLVHFDSKLQRLSVEQMSPPGAPLIYPNWFLKTKAFQDVARVSKYNKAVLKFRPDYKEIKTGPGGKELIKIVNGIDPESGGHPDNSYFLQIINRISL